MAEKRYASREGDNLQGAYPVFSSGEYGGQTPRQGTPIGGIDWLPGELDRTFDYLAERIRRDGCLSTQSRVSERA